MLINHYFNQVYLVPERLTTSNQVLLAVGVVLLCITIGVWILILLMLKRKTKFKGDNNNYLDSIQL